MKIVAGHHQQASEPTQMGCAVGIGIFDGVHRGHQALLRQVITLAEQESLEACAYTFDPHPAKVLRPALAPKLIEPISKRLERFAQLGLSKAVVEPFDREFAALEPEYFVEKILVNCLRAKHVVIGSGFTFGHLQKGNVELLQRLGKKFNFAVHAVSQVTVDGMVVSSTKVREFVSNGQMQGATLLLGRPYALYGKVVHGAHRGTSIGFPTANIQAQNELVPRGGVYAAIATGVSGRHNAVVNIGVNPTFGAETTVKIEAHLLDFNGESLYGNNLELEFIDRLRDEQRFESVQALVIQIKHDVLAARRLFMQTARS